LATAGDRPVADAHDDPGHVTWGWKDSLLGQKRWYYAKVLRNRATLISLETAPCFYALSENYGSPEEDYLTLYAQGRMTLEEKLVYETLLAEGPLDTIALRKAARLSRPEAATRFTRALTELQANFMILPTAVTQAGSWHYAYAYDLVSRHFPELIDQAQAISEQTARLKLLELYFKSVGAAQRRDLNLLFDWPARSLDRTLEQLVQAGQIFSGVRVEKQESEWIALADLIS
jgi:hypothetical protein